MDPPAMAPFPPLIISALHRYTVPARPNERRHGPREDVHRGTRRRPRRGDPEGARRPRERQPREDEDGRDVLDPLPQREGGPEGPRDLPRGHTRGPQGPHGGPR